MTRPTRVLWLAKGLGRGGAEKLLTSSAAHLDPARFAVEVAYLLPWKDALVPELTRYGLSVHCLEQRSTFSLAWVLRLRRLLRSGEFDIIHTHMPLPAAAARLLAGRTALVHTEHNVWDRYRWPTYWANALTYRRNDAVVAVSTAVLNSVPSKALPTAPATVEVLHHGVDPSSVRRGPAARGHARQLLGLAENDLVVGNVANFTPKKDQRRLLDAAARLLPRHPRLKLVMIGTGPLEGELRQHAGELGLGDAVQFTGSRDDVPTLLPALDLFCLCSLHEGLSIALVEAMASGVTPVCTAVGGVPEVVTSEQDGLLVPAADTAALTAALDRLLTDASLRDRLAEAAQARATAFDIAVAATRIETLYDEVLARR